MGQLSLVCQKVRCYVCSTLHYLRSLFSINSLSSEILCVWKFFSKPHTDHNNYLRLDGPEGPPPLLVPNIKGPQTVQFSHLVMSNSLRPHGLQHTRLPCPSPTPGALSNSCPSSQWCHPTISSSVVPFSCLQSFPASGSFPMSQCFASGDQSIGASASVLPIHTHTHTYMLLTQL